MRNNALRAALEKPEMAFGLEIDGSDPTLVEIAGLLGFDWIYIDAEHAAMTTELCLNMVRAADAVGVGSMIRVGTPDRAHVLPYIETGVNAIMLAHTNPSNAYDFAAELLYPPRGRRGLTMDTRAEEFGLRHSPVEQYTTDESRPIGTALLEDLVGFEGAEELVKIDGLDLFDFGLSDLSGSMGIPGQINDPRLQEHLDRAIAAVQAGGKWVQIAARSLAMFDKAVTSGADTVMVSSRPLLVGGVRAFNQAWMANEAFPPAQSDVSDIKRAVKLARQKLSDK